MTFLRSQLTKKSDEVIASPATQLGHIYDVGIWLGASNFDRRQISMLLVKYLTKCMIYLKLGINIWCQLSKFLTADVKYSLVTLKWSFSFENFDCRHQKLTPNSKFWCLMSNTWCRSSNIWLTESKFGVRQNLTI